MASDRFLTLADVADVLNISASQTYALVRNGELDGWRPDERELVAQVARYYRRAMPKPGHLDYAALTPADRRRVDVLAALLRVADGLDSRHQGLVTDVACRAEGGRIVISAQADGEVSGELAAATEKADVFERAFGMPAAFEAVDGVRA